MEDEDIPPNNSVDDWLEQQEQLPVRCPSFIELRYTRHFAVDVNGVQGHDHYVYIAPNGVAVMGLAPSHVMITAYKKSKADGSLSAGKHQEGGVVSQKAEPEETQGVAGEHATGDNTEDAGVGPAQTAGPREPSKSSENGGEEAGVGQGEGEDGQVSASATQHQPPEQLNRKRRRGGGQSGEPDNQAVHFFPPEQLAKVNFDLGKRSATTKQSGKKRGQGSHLDAGTVVCKLESSAGPCINIRAVVPGKLLEVNQQIIQKPELLLQRPCREGYLAAMYPNDSQMAALKNNLLTMEAYLEKRGLTADDLL